MKLKQRIAGYVVLAAIATGTFIFMNEEKKTLDSKGFVGRNEITVEDGRMTPEVLLALGRLSDPQVSPDGKHILYGVSYTSVEENKSVRNLWICNLDGSDARQVTESGKSMNNARWSADGKKIAFTMGGQIWTGRIA